MITKEELLSDTIWMILTGYSSIIPLLNKEKISTLKEKICKYITKFLS